MLVALRIRNLALIEDLTWELAPGFNILTGETGAGKSILIDALNLLLGERADKSLIRSGTETCTVESELQLPTAAPIQPEIDKLLLELGIEPVEAGQLFLKRTISLGGANRQFINGSPVPLQTLKSLGDLLVDVHGPHDHQSLLDPRKQAALLDAYGRHESLHGPLREAWLRLQAIQREQKALELSEEEQKQKIDRLRHQVEEIGALQMKPGEDDQLENDYRAASHAQTIVEQAAQISGLLSEAEGAILTQLAKVERLLNAWQRVDASIAEAEPLNRQAIAQLQELLVAVQERADRVELDPVQLQHLEERLNRVQSLKRKYGGTIESILAIERDAAAQLEACENRQEQVAQLADRVRRAQHELSGAVQALTQARTKMAPPLGIKITQELRSLGFNQACFEVRLGAAAHPSASGADEIEFIFSPNPGEAARPLRAIASSGEMARVMLAIKTTLAEVDSIPILIFDEVDANVGGETALQVGKRLRGLGVNHQVLCITHLPQVAAQGEAHFAVEKRLKQDRTTTALVRLEAGEREREIARMLGGQNVAALALAKTLLAEPSQPGKSK